MVGTKGQPANIIKHNTSLTITASNHNTVLALYHRAQSARTTTGKRSLTEQPKRFVPTHSRKTAKARE